MYFSTGGAGGDGHAVQSFDFVAQTKAAFHYLRIDADSTRLTIHAVGADGKELESRPTVLTLPSIVPGDSVLNGASFTAAVAPGGIVSVFGRGLANDTLLATTAPWPQSLTGTSVTVNGLPLSLYYVSPTQINAQLRFDQQGPVTLRVTTAGGFSEASLNISETAPAIFDKSILHANYTPVSAAAPARPGEVLIIFATGLGQVDAKLDSGQVAPTSPLARSIAPLVVQVGGSSIVPDFAGLAPGFIGLYQVNVTIPLDLQTTTYPLRLMSKGNLSNSLNIQVSAPNR
jgi:uncharacterized protein (TIGR03437 family)